MNMEIKTALCDNGEVYTHITDRIENENKGVVTQGVTIQYNDTEVEYTLKRNLIDGGNISDIEKHFSNIPYIENGKKCYDKDLSLLNEVFDGNNNDYFDIDQALWEADPQKSFEAELELYNMIEYENVHMNVIITVNYNELTTEEK